MKTLTPDDYIIRKCVTLEILIWLIKMLVVLLSTITTAWAPIHNLSDMKFKVKCILTPPKMISKLMLIWLITQTLWWLRYVPHHRKIWLSLIIWWNRVWAQRIGTMFRYWRKLSERLLNKTIRYANHHQSPLFLTLNLPIVDIVTCESLRTGDLSPLERWATCSTR